MKKYKALFLWKVNTVLKDHISKELKKNNVKLIFPKEKDEDLFLKLAPAIDIVIGWQPSSAFIKKAKKLKLIINPGAGIQHLTDKFDLLKSKGILLVNGHGNAYFTAQHIVAMLLSVCNRIINSSSSLTNDPTKNLSFSYLSLF